MAIDYASNLGWHEGEQQMQQMLHVPARENPTSQGLTPYGVRILHISSLLALGTLDDEGRPWTTLLGGQPGFARSIGQSAMGVKALVDSEHDPVLKLLFSGEHGREDMHSVADGRLMSALAINLATRDRVKLAGTIVAGTLQQSEPGSQHRDRVSELQMAFKVEQSLGNCPKYLNKKTILESRPHPILLSDTLPLSQSAAGLIAKADLFFISSSHQGTTIGTNHRGGPPGFVRVSVDDDSTTSLVWPEYSGNRLYQTLGNLKTTPRAGLVFPDFDTGDVLYVTCTTEVTIGKEAAALLPRSNLLVKARIDAARFVRQGLSFRGQSCERSPYNPPVRLLASERQQYGVQTSNKNVAYAKLIGKEVLTPTIARLRFSISDPETAERWNPGQYVALAFEDELSAGYSHMRDDDPKSLNDDYVRTFTVSSSMTGQGYHHNEFEITMRNVGEVTRFLFRQEIRSGLEIPLRGFGGTFTISQSSTETVQCVAGGIGITPILAYLPHLDLEHLKLYWTINVQDINLVVDTFRQHPALAPSTSLFISGIVEDNNVEAKAVVTELERSRASVSTRRMEASDLQGEQDSSSTWYICTSTAFRQALLAWLSGKHVVFEDFNY